MQWLKTASKESIFNTEILSFADYISYLETAPHQAIRPTYSYLIDMFNFFGKGTDGSFSIFKSEENDSPAVRGQQKCQETIFQNLINFQDEGKINRFLLLVGPNGSAKSSIVKKIMEGAERYSQKDEGKQYTFSWVFPIQNYVKGTLGLTNDSKPHDLPTYAYLADKEISAILPSELKDHPILLIPTKYRQEYIDAQLKDHPELLQTIKKSSLYDGDLSKRNKMIYDALLKSYKGDHTQVLKHIKIERFHVSRRYSSAAVTIEPQLHVDARIQQITMDKRLQNLPPSLQSLNLYTIQGEAIMANRGILEFSDLLKRPIDAFKYLLTTMETNSLNLQGVLTLLDIFFIGTSNEIHMQAFKQHPDFNSFKGRFNFIKVPYLTNYVEEVQIYQQQVDTLSERIKFEPHALEALSLYSVLTRLRAPKLENYLDKKLADNVIKLNPLEKAFFITNPNKLPESFNLEIRQIFKQCHKKICNEFEIDMAYEGKFGISPRDIKKIIYKLSNKYSQITFIEILEYLEKMIKKVNEYDFLAIQPERDFHNNSKFLESLKEHFLTIFDDELRDSLGLVDNRSYEEYLKKYMEQIKSLIKGEKVKNVITGKFEEVDMFFVEEFERGLKLNESAEKFRSHLISRLGAYFLDNPKKEIIYTNIFSDITKKLQETFREEQKKTIANISKNLVFFQAEITTKDKEVQLSDKHRKLLTNVIEQLHNKFGYSKHGAIRLVKYLIDEKY